MHSNCRREHDRSFETSKVDQNVATRNHQTKHYLPMRKGKMICGVNRILAFHLDMRFLSAADMFSSCASSFQSDRENIYFWSLLTILNSTLMTFNSSRRSYAIWQHRTGSTLTLVMAWCPVAPNHHLNQCWRIVLRFIDIHSGAILQELPQPSITRITWKWLL